MPLAIEPLHPMYAADRASINTLEQALDVCDLLGDGVGVAIDVYHVWWDPKLYAQIARAGANGRILAHHICDWLVPTRDLLLDRGMMGDGIIDLRAIRVAMEKARYRGPQEVEIFSSEIWWQRPPISGFFHRNTDGSEIDNAVTHHAAVEQEIARGNQPVADVVSKNASVGSCPRDLRVKLRVPPNVVDIDCDTDSVS